MPRSSQRPISSCEASRQGQRAARWARRRGPPFSSGWPGSSRGRCRTSTVRDARRSVRSALDAEQAWIMILGFFWAPASDRCARARAQSAHLIDKPFPKHRRPLKKPSFVSGSDLGQIRVRERPRMPARAARRPYRPRTHGGICRASSTVERARRSAGPAPHRRRLG
jgi:hypothetical protein